MGKSSIEWTEETWNPTRGCSRISPGCVNCYAERMAARDLPGMKSPTTGEPFAIITPSGPRWTGKLELIPHMLDVPLRRKKPTTYFVNSMSDLFHEDLPDEAIDRVFAVMALCPQHTFQVLTKRADRMRAWFDSPFLRRRLDDLVSHTAWLGFRDSGAPVCDDRPNLGHRIIIRERDKYGNSPCWPLLNVHLGVSVENQEYADKRIPDLLATPAAVRFVSYEPALGPVDFTPWLCDCRRVLEYGKCEHPHLHQIIIGGESGPGARPFDLAWARNTIAQCEAAGVAAFVKQLGAKPWDSATGECDHLFAHCGHACECCDDCPRPSSADGQVDREKHPQLLRLKDRKGGSMDEWPADLRVRQTPEVRQ